MTDYFEHNARLNGRQEIKLDVIEFEPQSTCAGMEVRELQFDSTGEYLRFIARETGRGR